MYLTRFSFVASVIIHSLPFAQGGLLQPRRADVEAAANQHGVLQNVKEYLFGKRQDRTCTEDVILSVMYTYEPATPWCQTFIQVPPATAEVDYTSTSTTVVVTGTRAATVTNVVRTTSVVTETATVRGVQKRQEPPHPTRRMLLNRAALMDYQIRALVDGQYDNSTQLDALGLQLSSACSCLNIPPPYTTTISYAAPVVVTTVNAVDQRVVTVASTLLRTTTTTTTIYSNDTESISATSGPVSGTSAESNSTQAGNETGTSASDTAEASSGASQTTGTDIATSASGAIAVVRPTAPAFNCPGDNNKTVDNIVDDRRFTYLVLCDTELTDENLPTVLDTETPSDCAAYCSTADNSFNSSSCAGITYDPTNSFNCELKASANNPQPSVGKISAVLLEVTTFQSNSTNFTAQTGSRVASPQETSSSLASIFATSIDIITPAPLPSATGGNGAWSTSWSSGYTESGVYYYSYGSAYASSSQWWQTYNEEWTTIFQNTQSIYSSSSGNGGGSAGGNGTEAVGVTSIINGTTWVYFTGSSFIATSTSGGLVGTAAPQTASAQATDVGSSGAQSGATGISISGASEGSAASSGSFAPSVTGLPGSSNSSAVEAGTAVSATGLQSESGGSTGSSEVVAESASVPSASVTPSVSVNETAIVATSVEVTSNGTAVEASSYETVSVPISASVGVSSVVSSAVNETASADTSAATASGESGISAVSTAISESSSGEGNVTLSGGTENVAPSAAPVASTNATVEASVTTTSAGETSVEVSVSATGVESQSNAGNVTAPIPTASTGPESSALPSNITTPTNENSTAVEGTSIVSGGISTAVSVVGTGELTNILPSAGTVSPIMSMNSSAAIGTEEAPQTTAAVNDTTRSVTDRPRSGSFELTSTFEANSTAIVGTGTAVTDQVTATSESRPPYVPESPASTSESQGNETSLSNNATFTRSVTDRPRSGEFDTSTEAISNSSIVTATEAVYPTGSLPLPGSSPSEGPVMSMNSTSAFSGTAPPYAVETPNISTNATTESPVATASTNETLTTSLTGTAASETPIMSMNSTGPAPTSPANETSTAVNETGTRSVTDRPRSGEFETTSSIFLNITELGTEGYPLPTAPPYLNNSTESPSGVPSPTNGTDTRSVSDRPRSGTAGTASTEIANATVTSFEETASVTPILSLNSTLIFSTATGANTTVDYFTTPSLCPCPTTPLETCPTVSSVTTVTVTTTVSDCSNCSTSATPPASYFL